MDLHRVFGWVVVLRAAAWVVCAVRMVPCDELPYVDSIPKGVEKACECV